MVSAVRRVAPLPPRKSDDPSLNADQTAIALWQHQLQIAQGAVAQDKTAIQATQQQLDHLTHSFDGLTSAIRNPVAWFNQYQALETTLHRQQAKLAFDQALVGQDQKYETAAYTQAGVDAQNVKTYWDNQAKQDGIQHDKLAQDAANLQNKLGVSPGLLGHGESLSPLSYTPEQLRQQMINADIVAIAVDKSYLAGMKVQLDLAESDLAGAQQKLYTDLANPRVSTQTLQQDQAAVDSYQSTLNDKQADYDNAVSDTNKDISAREAQLQQLQGKQA